MGSAATFDLEIWFEGKDEPLKVRADQRDMAAFELAHNIGSNRALETMTMRFFRELGWYACNRLGLLDEKEPKPDWLDRVVSVEPEDEDEDEDPTKPAP